MLLLAKKVRCEQCIIPCIRNWNTIPLAEERFLDLDAYGCDLARLASVQGIEGYFDCICLMGGEPLLHPRVDEVMRITRNRLPNETIMLSTNGLLLRRMNDTFWQTLTACDVELAISPYPIGVDYPALIDLARSKGVRVSYTTDRTGSGGGKEHFIRLALDPSGSQSPAASFASRPFGGVNLQLEHSAIWPCQVAAHRRMLERRFGYDLHDCPDDSLPLELIGTVDQIEEFRRRTHPMCRFCANDRLTIAAWGRSSCNPSEWLVDTDA